MLYYLLKYISQVMMRVYFGKVYIDGLENVPRDKPLVLASNHQSAFIEPVLLGGMMPFPVHFITRGDIFVKRWMWFFNAVNMIPIFRFHDGFKSMKKNMDSFQHVYDALNNGARVIIFCEGHMKWEKKLHSLQLGAARLALGAYVQDPDSDIHVLPIGINYEDHLTFRRYVKISFGKPIRVADHTAELEKSQRPALKSITQELAKRLKPEVIHIGTEDHYALGNAILSIKDNNEQRTFLPFYAEGKNAIRTSVTYAQDTEKLDTNPTLVALTNQYKEALADDFTYRDYALKHAEDFTLLRAMSYYLVLMPLGVIGTIINGLPGFLAEKITHSRTKVPEFIGALKANLGSMLHFVYVLIILIPCFIYCWHIGLLVFGAMLFTAMFAMYFWDRKKYWKANRYWKSVSPAEKERLLTLRNRLDKSF